MPSAVRSPSMIDSALAFRSSSSSEPATLSMAAMNSRGLATFHHLRAVMPSLQ